MARSIWISIVYTEYHDLNSPLPPANMPEHILIFHTLVVVMCPKIMHTSKSTESSTFCSCISFRKLFHGLDLLITILADLNNIRELTCTCSNAATGTSGIPTYSVTSLKQTKIRFSIDITWKKYLMINLIYVKSYPLVSFVMYSTSVSMSQCRSLSNANHGSLHLQ